MTVRGYGQLTSRYEKHVIPVRLALVPLPPVI